MIVTNSKGKKIYEGKNKSKIARLIGYHRISIYRWVKNGFGKKESFNGCTLYLDESLYKPKK